MMDWKGKKETQGPLAYQEQKEIGALWDHQEIAESEVSWDK